MSVEAFSWALTVPVGGNQKVILLGLANHAHPDGTESYPALDTLAGYAHCDRSTARRNVRKLLDGGWISEDGEGPRGTIKYSLSMVALARNAGSGVDCVYCGCKADLLDHVVPRSRGGGQLRNLAPACGACNESKGATDLDAWVARRGLDASAIRQRLAAYGVGGILPPTETQRGGTGASVGVAPMPPEPSIEPSLKKESAPDARDQIPNDFPDELRPHAREVMRILRAVAEQHGARKVWPQKVALVVMAHPRHALVATAHDLAAWAVDAKRPIKDVVATYSTFLKRDGELAARERLAEDGTPCTAPAPSRNGNVHPITAARKPTTGQLLDELRAANPRLNGAATAAAGPPRPLLAEGRPHA